MPVIKRRSKMMTIRMSEKEYQDIQNLCMREGARSVSDLARAALQSRVNSLADGRTDVQVEDMFRAIRSSIQEIDKEVKRLVEGLTIGERAH
jgi:hypothetical protein